MFIKSVLFAAAALAVAAMDSAALADPIDNFRVTGPAVRENLSVYFVHGDGGGAAPLTLDQAMANGSVKIHETERHPLQIENVSGQSVFIQLGDLIRGGLQDQVAGTSLLLPPYSGLTNLATFCVDPFRSSARDDESPKLFSSVGALFPSRLAKLGILAGASDAKVVASIRESAVWWSIDTLRSELERKLGEPIEPPKIPHWGDNATDRANTALAARRSPWTTSLPLALENPRLIEAQRAFTDAFMAGDEQRDDVVGAVFAINGQVVGADLYQSHGLFRQMWPKLLRAYATEALATTAVIATTSPATEDVSAFLAAAREGRLREQSAGEPSIIRDSDAAIFAETVDRSGDWVYRNSVPKLGTTTTPHAPEALLVRMLETGEVDGRSLASLGANDAVTVSRNGDDWETTIQVSKTPSSLPRRLDNNAGVIADVVQALAMIAALLTILGLAVRLAVRLAVALGRRIARPAAYVFKAAAGFARQAATYVAVAARWMLRHLDPTRLASPVALLRVTMVAVPRAYARRLPAMTAVSIVALAISHQVVRFW